MKKKTRGWAGWQRRASALWREGGWGREWLLLWGWAWRGRIGVGNPGLASCVCTATDAPRGRSSLPAARTTPAERERSCCGWWGCGVGGVWPRVDGVCALWVMCFGQFRFFSARPAGCDALRPSRRLREGVDAVTGPGVPGVHAHAAPLPRRCGSTPASGGCQGSHRVRPRQEWCSKDRRLDLEEKNGPSVSPPFGDIGVRPPQKAKTTLQGLHTQGLGTMPGCLVMSARARTQPKHAPLLLPAIFSDGREGQETHRPFLPTPAFVWVFFVALCALPIHDTFVPRSA